MLKQIILVFLIAINWSFSQIISEPNLPPIESFQDGEWFQLRLHYGPFNASYASFSLESDSLNNKAVFHAKGFGETTGIAKWFFKVEDYYESYFDQKTGLPYKFVRDINEGGYTKNIEIDFDHDEATAFVHDKKRNEINEFSIEYGVQDLISSFYFLRKFYPKKGVKVNESFDINMFFDNENYVFKLKHLGSETIRSKFGKIRCLKFRPFVQSGRVFEEQESVTLWVSDDKNRLHIRLQADILVGSIKADLENFKNLRHPFEILVE